MTDAQAHLHWKTWNRVAVANGWRMRKGRLVCVEEQETRGDARPPRSEHQARVWAFAEQLAARAHRAVTADDLRHACYQAAFGRVASMKMADPMTNGEFNRLLALFALLENPDSIQAQVDWMNPEDATRRGMVAAILRNAPGEAYVIAISKNKFGTPAWRDLGDRQLRQLTITLKERSRKVRKGEWRGQKASQSLVTSTATNSGDPF